MRKISTIEKFASSLLTLTILMFTIILHLSCTYVIYKAFRICTKFTRTKDIDMREFKKVLLGFIFESLIVAIISYLRKVRNNIDDKNAIETWFDKTLNRLKEIVPKILERLQHFNKWVYYNINV